MHLGQIPSPLLGIEPPPPLVNVCVFGKGKERSGEEGEELLLPAASSASSSWATKLA